MHETIYNEKSVAAILAEIKDDLKQLLETRFALLKAESREKIKICKVAVPLAIAGLVMLTMAYLLFTIALVGLIFALLPESSFRWCLAFLAVAVLWSILGGIAAYMAKRRFEANALMPNKTIRVLKADRLWIQSEVNSRI